MAVAAPVGKAILRGGRDFLFFARSTPGSGNGCHLLGRRCAPQRGSNLAQLFVCAYPPEAALGPQHHSLHMHRNALHMNRLAKH